MPKLTQKADLAETIKAKIAEVLKKTGTEDTDFSLEHPADVTHGDYATNVALIAGKKMGVSPREIAESLQKELSGSIPDVEKIDIAGPGFINFYLSRDFFKGQLAHIATADASWGTHSIGNGAEVLLEYTSPNLFKPLHVGNLVGNIVGESLARLYEYAGSDVRRINYPSDIGLTVAKGVWGITHTNGDPDVIEDLGKAYVAGNTAYEEGEEAKEEIDTINQSLYKGDDETLNDIRDRGIKTSRTRLSELCEILGTSFDSEIFESESGPVGAEIVKAHIKDGVFEESDGAVVYRGEKEGLHTRVFLNSQGLPTYEAKDLGNFRLKQEQYPNWTHSLVVTGNEQSEYFKVLFSALRELFPQTKEKMLAHIATGFLTLSTGKMSSREGNVLTGESLLEELREEALVRAKETRAEDTATLANQIAVSALKYQILRQRVGLDIVFNKERALSFEGDSGPYLQYTHARASSVIEKATQEGIAPEVNSPPSEIYSIERLLYQFPEMTKRALAEHSPHHLVVFLTTLAGAFNSFYATEKIADKADKNAPYKVAIADATRITLKNGLHALGIESPERM